MVTALPLATLVVYAVLIQPILYCVWKHGTRGLLGWMTIQIFCCIRIVGSILQIKEASAASQSTATLIITNIGLSPMLLGVAGILHEAYVTHISKWLFMAEIARLILTNCQTNEPKSRHEQQS